MSEIHFLAERGVPVAVVPVGHAVLARRFCQRGSRGVSPGEVFLSRGRQSPLGHAKGVDTGTRLHHFALDHFGTHGADIAERGLGHDFLLLTLYFVYEKLDLSPEFTHLSLVLLPHFVEVAFPLPVQLFLLDPLGFPPKLLAHPVNLQLQFANEVVFGVDFCHIVLLHFASHLCHFRQLPLHSFFLPKCFSQLVAADGLLFEHLELPGVQMGKFFVERLQFPIVVFQIVNFLLTPPQGCLQCFLLVEAPQQFLSQLPDLLLPVTVITAEQSIGRGQLGYNLKLFSQIGLPFLQLLAFSPQDLIFSVEEETLVAIVRVFEHGCYQIIMSSQQYKAVIKQYKQSSQQQQIRSIMLNIANTELLRKMVSAFPSLLHHQTKGQNGRVAVIGGSFQFTGAPYYSAISALKVGGDLSHIFCSKFSSPAIKSYSPEIITHPLFISREQLTCEVEQQAKMLDHWAWKLKSWEKAIHCWVIGPGLGRDKYMQNFFPKMVKGLPNNCLVIFDADGIYYLCQHPELFPELQRFKTIVTPNSRELAYLQKHFNIPRDQILDQCQNKEDIEQIEGDWSYLPFSVIVKGKRDVIIGRNKSFVVGVEGGNKRCGGIGDVVAGVASVCSLWDFQYGLPLSSVIVRAATKMAFARQGRGLTAPCVIEYLSRSVKHLESVV